jgi:tetratricopeptide (TPR) repeat protein
VAKKLNVAHILEGSVRKAGKQLHITAQLIEASTDTSLWSETYERPLDNIFAIQDEISSEVIKALRLRLLGDVPSTALTDTEAYTLYLKGKHFEALDGRESWELSESAYRAALATIQFAYDWDWSRAAGSIRTALQYGPRNAAALETAALIYRGLGQYEPAINIAQKAVELNPINLSSLRNLGVTYWLASKFSEAEEIFYQVLELYPELETIRAFVAVQLVLQEKPEDAKGFIKAGSENVWQRFVSAMILHALGRDEDSMRVLQRLIDEHKEALAFQIAEIHAVRGSPDEAFEWLEFAYRQKDAGFTQVLLDPFLVSLHDDPRWEPVLLKVGLLDYWKELQATGGPAPIN